MRSFTIALSACSLFTLMLGCEDGPKQTYEPSPASAATTFNDGKTPPFVDPATQSYAIPDGGDNGATANEICTGAEKQMRWGTGFKEPVFPPRFASGLDLAGDDTWIGLTVYQAEHGFQRQDSTQFPQYKGAFAKMCQSTPIDLGDNYWGDNGEIQYEYLTTTQDIDYMFLNLGYTGAMEFDSRPGSAWGPHHYSVAVGLQIQRDGLPVLATWTNTDKADPSAWANEFYDAAIYAFAPTIPPNPPGSVAGTQLDAMGNPIFYPTSCYLSGGCVLNAFSGDQPYWYTPALGVGFVMGVLSQGPIAGSTPVNMQMIKTKLFGFSLSDATLQFHNGGPFGLDSAVGFNRSRCQFYMGVDYSDFLANCVEVTGNPVTDQIELSKLLGGLQHGPERFIFDIQGIDVKFTDAQLQPDQIVGDADRPGPGDYMTQVDVDQSMLGKITNDYVNNDPTLAQDLHGTGLVYLEYARLVQSELNKYIVPANRHYLGDPACLGTNIKKDPVTNAYSFPDGCTGFEGFVAPLNATGSTGVQVPVPTGPDTAFISVNMIDHSTVAEINAGIGSGLKPGNPIAIFCTVLVSDAANGCDADKGGMQGALWATSEARVLQALGKGNINNLPPDVRDNRFFFKQFIRATAKYLLSVGIDETPDGVHNQPLDADDLFFDSSGQFESGEYIFRAEVGQQNFYSTQLQTPTDLNITADVLNGILNDYDFDRTMLRGEAVLYTEMLDTTNPAAQLGGDVGDEIRLTNLAGNNWLNTHFAMAPNGDPYYCATNYDLAKCGGAFLPPIDHSPGATGNTPLLNDNGDPVLAPYKGAITGQTEFSIGLFQRTDPNDATKTIIYGTNMTVDQTFPLIESAQITLPLHTDPFSANAADPATDPGFAPPASGASITRLVPWTVKQSGVGFAIPKSATTDNFIETYAVNLTGETVNANIDYDYIVNPDGTSDPSKLQIKAIEASEFLGQLFMCDSPDPLATSKQEGATDVLTVRMYDTIAGMLDWFQTHPGSRTSCDIVIRYSPFNNYVDYITSRTYGVQVAVTQGGGGGRIVDATLFDPNTVQ